MKKLRRFFRSFLFLSVLPYLYKAYMWIVVKTSRVVAEGLEEAEAHLASGKNAIWAVWHQDMFIGPFFFQGRDIGILISPSRDGAIIAHLLQKIGFIPIWGSSRKDAKEGLQGLINFLQEKQGHILGITPDGPIGPVYRAKKGAIVAASATGTRIFPLRFDAKRKWVMSSWDRTAVPLPFTTILISFGTPLDVPKGLSEDQLEAYRKRFEEELLRLVEHSQNFFSVKLA